MMPPTPEALLRTMTAADVIGPTGQGVAVGDFQSVIQAVASGVTYANVHTTQMHRVSAH
jgi:hypothetical protein